MTATPPTTPVTVRMPWNMLERVDALKPMLHAKDRSEVTRTLVEYGILALVGGAPPPPRKPPPMGEGDAAAVQKYLVWMLLAHFDAVADVRPGQAVADAWRIGGELVKWSDGIAAKYETTAQELVDATDAQ